MLTLFAHPLSPHSRKAHFVLEESGHPYNYQLVDLAKGEQKSAMHLARNPVGKVPVLQEDEFLLAESGAILQYVAENYAAGKLLPTDKHLRARVNQWLFWQPGEANQILHKPFQVKVFARLAGKTFDEAAFEQAVQACDPVLKQIDDALVGKQFMVGDTFSIADIAIVESLFQLHIVDIHPHHFRNVQSFFERVSQRPAFQKTRPPK
jgi:glutathione S-transferase